MTAFIIVLIGAFENLLSENYGKTFKDVKEVIKMPSMTICPFTVYRLDSKNLTTYSLPLVHLILSLKLSVSWILFC